MSGKSLKRPGIQSALRRLKRRKASALVVAKMDRLSRSLLDFAGVMATARSRGWAVVAVDVGVDMTPPSRRAGGRRDGEIAQWERRMIAQRTREAVAQQRGKVARLALPMRTPAS